MGGSSIETKDRGEKQIRGTWARPKLNSKGAQKRVGKPDRGAGPKQCKFAYSLLKEKITSLARMKGTLEDPDPKAGPAWRTQVIPKLGT